MLWEDILEIEGSWESLLVDWRNDVDFLQIQYWKAAARNRRTWGPKIREGMAQAS
jgi:hypothetical protein